MSSLRRSLFLSAKRTALMLLVGGFSVTSFSPKIFASAYDIPVFYLSPIYNCYTGVGCCMPSGVKAIVNDLVRGEGFYSFGLNLQQSFYTDFLAGQINEATPNIANEVRNSSLFLIGTMGAAIDAQTLTQTMNSMGQSKTSSLQKYTASEQICRFGTLGRSLAESQQISATSQSVLAKGMLNRELMQLNMNSGSEQGSGRLIGRTADKLGRIGQYRKTFCDPSDSAGGISGICSATDNARRNQDIDIDRALFDPLSKSMDLASTGGGTLTADEEGLLALANNLYAHDLPTNITVPDIKSLTGSSSSGASEILMDYRALTAKRSVAANSFAALAAKKAAGSAASATYMKQMLERLGLDEAGQTKLLGAKPSYEAQMELLTKLLYQSPEFYANLMESPSNVARQQVALEGIALMQDRDIHESLRRSEMVMSTLLEVYLAQEQAIAKDKAVK